MKMKIMTGALALSVLAACSSDTGGKGGQKNATDIADFTIPVGKVVSEETKTFLKKKQDSIKSYFDTVELIYDEEKKYSTADGDEKIWQDRILEKCQIQQTVNERQGPSSEEGVGPGEQVGHKSRRSIGGADCPLEDSKTTASLFSVGTSMPISTSGTSQDRESISYKDPDLVAIIGLRSRLFDINGTTVSNSKPNGGGEQVDRKNGIAKFEFADATVLEFKIEVLHTLVWAAHNRSDGDELENYTSASLKHATIKIGEEEVKVSYAYSYKNGERDGDFKYYLNGHEIDDNEYYSMFGYLKLGQH